MVHQPIVGVPLLLVRVVPLRQNQVDNDVSQLLLRGRLGARKQWGVLDCGAETLPTPHFGHELHGADRRILMRHEVS